MIFYLSPKWILKNEIIIQHLKAKPEKGTMVLL